MPVAQDKILMISYKFPPIKSIGAIRNYNVAKQFRRHFEEIHVITTEDRQFLPQEALPCYTTIPTYPVPTWDYRHIVHSLSGRRVSLEGNASTNRLVSQLLRLKDSFPFNIFLDEGALVYILAAVRQGRKLIREHGIRYLYSSFRPYADHLAAYLLKLEFPQLIWIADFRDPHVDLNRDNVLFPALQHWFNRRIMRRADVVTTVSQGLADYFRRYRDDIYVLRNGIDPALSVGLDAEISSKFTITYTGSIYADKQRADLLLHSLRTLIDEGRLPAGELELVYAGKDHLTWQRWVHQYGLDACSVIFPQLDMPEALRLQRRSQLNLLMSWSGPEIKGILTGKLYEYLAARRPILTVINGDRDPEFERIFRELQAGLVCYDQDPKGQEALSAFLLERFAHWKAGGGQQPFISQAALERYQWDHLMDQFVEFLGKGNAEGDRVLFYGKVRAQGLG